MSSMAVSENVVLCAKSYKVMTVGAFIRALNETGVIKIAHVINCAIGRTSDNYIDVETESGKVVKIRIDFNSATHTSFFACIVYVPCEYGERVYTLFRTFGHFNIKAVYSGERLYKDQVKIGFLSVYKKDIVAFKVFEDKTGICINLCRRPREGSYFCPLDSINVFSKDFTEVGNYFRSIEPPINPEEIFEKILNIVGPKSFKMLEVCYYKDCTSTVASDDNNDNTKGFQLITSYVSRQDEDHGDSLVFGFKQKIICYNEENAWTYTTDDGLMLKEAEYKPISSLDGGTLNLKFNEAKTDLLYLSGDCRNMFLEVSKLKEHMDVFQQYIKGIK